MISIFYLDLILIQEEARWLAPPPAGHHGHNLYDPLPNNTVYRHVENCKLGKLFQEEHRKLLIQLQ
jgi:hypothetical protein